MPPADVDALLALAVRLERDGRAGRVAAAAAARIAAVRLEREGGGGAPAHTAAIRRRALDLAVQLDLLGYPGEADAVCEEVVHRARLSPVAMGDRAFVAWLEAVEKAIGDGDPVL